MASMQLNDVSAERLTRLASFEPGSERVLSVYLNLDPHDFSTQPARDSAVTSILNEAARQVEDAEVPHEVHMALREDLDRIRTELEENLTDGHAEGAHALALFACGPRDLFEIIRLPRPVPNEVVLAPKPAVQPLAEAGPAERWLVVLVDGRVARVLDGLGDRLVEAESVRDEAKGKTSQGGWSAARYQRAVDKEARDHLMHVAEILGEHARRREYAFLLVGATPETWSEFEKVLPAELAGLVEGRFDADADHTPVDEVRDRVEELLRKRETRVEREALDRVGQNGVRGLADTLPALYERRVETLLITPRLEAPGAVCVKCGWMAPDTGACPVDGTPMEPRGNVVEAAIASAVEGDAAVLVVRRHEDELEPYGGIAGALRY